MPGLTDITTMCHVTLFTVFIFNLVQTAWGEESSLTLTLYLTQTEELLFFCCMSKRAAARGAVKTPGICIIATHLHLYDH